jgi:flagellar motor switch protein FliM
MTPEPTTFDANGLADLLAQAVAETQGAAGSNARDFDWRTPARFTLPQRERLDAFARQAAARISAELRSLLRRPMAFTAGPVAQHYGRDLWKPDQTPVYAVPLTGPGGQTCGMVTLTPELAIHWVERLLGGGDSTAEGNAPPAAPKDKATGLRTLSSLEQALLVDIVAAMVKAFCAAAKETGGKPVQHVETVATDQSPLADAARHEFCRLVLTAEAAGPPTPDAATPGTPTPSAPTPDAAAAPADAMTIPGSITLCLLSDLLTAIADPDSLKNPPRKAEDIHKDLLGCLAGVPVTATARLGAAVATMRDIASLEPGDILLLRRAVNEPVELVVKGNTVQVGLPVTSGGFYALQIQEQRQWPRVTTLDKEPKP